MMQLAFWFLVLSILYVYLGYPLLLLILSKLRTAQPEQKANITSIVCIIIFPYNEEKVIVPRFKNTWRSHSLMNETNGQSCGGTN